MTNDAEVRTNARSAMIAEWYTNVFPLIADYVKRNGGDFDEAKEIFQDSIVFYYEKLTLFGFTPKYSHEAYLTGIAKKRWLKYSSQKNRFEELAEIDAVDEKEQEPITQKLLQYMKLTGEKCLSILQAFYYEKLTIRQLTYRFGYNSERSTTVQKYKCLEKMRNEIKDKLLNYADFIK